MESDSTRISELLVGLGGVEVLTVEEQPGGPLRVSVRRMASRPPCESCGGVLWSDGDKQVELVDLPSFGRSVCLVWHKRRWRCHNRECPAGTMTEQAAEIAAPREQLTARAGRWATRQAGKGRPIKDIAEELGCSWHPVNLSMRRWGEALLEADKTRIGKVTALGLDETLMYKRGPFKTKAWATSIVDTATGRLLDVVTGRTAVAATRWIMGRPLEWRAAIRWAVPGSLRRLPGGFRHRCAPRPSGSGPVSAW